MTYKKSMDEFCREYKYTRISVRAFFKDFTRFVQDRLVAGDTVKIMDFLEFSAPTYDRPMYNFKTGETYTVDNYRVPKVKFSKTFKELMRFQLNEIDGLNDIDRQE